MPWLRPFPSWPFFSILGCLHLDLRRVVPVFLVVFFFFFVFSQFCTTVNSGAFCSLSESVVTSVSLSCSEFSKRRSQVVVLFWLLVPDEVVLFFYIFNPSIESAVSSWLLCSSGRFPS